MVRHDAEPLTREPVQSLWIGPALSRMERLAIESFLRRGHPFHLYVYDEVANVPEGTTLRDAAAVLPRERVFRYREHATYSGFSNYFRYRLLLERGGWWVDTDVVCRKPFAFATEHVFASEPARGDAVVASCVLRAPAGSPAIEHAWHACDSRDPASLRWGETGPSLCAEIVRRFALDECVQSPEVFCPVPYWQWRSFLDPEADVEAQLPAEAHAVHLWNEMWRRGGAEKDAADPRSFYGALATP